MFEYREYGIPLLPRKSLTLPTDQDNQDRGRNYICTLPLCIAYMEMAKAYIPGTSVLYDLAHNSVAIVPFVRSLHALWFSRTLFFLRRPTQRTPFSPNPTILHRSFGCIGSALGLQPLTPTLTTGYTWAVAAGRRAQAVAAFRALAVVALLALAVTALLALAQGPDWPR